MKESNAFGRALRAHNLIEEALRLWNLPGNKNANLEKAIQLLDNAAASLGSSPEELPVRGHAYYEAGLAFTELTAGVELENFAQAVARYERAAASFSLKHFPDEYSMVQQNLASALATMAALNPLNPSITNRAIEVYEGALRAHELRRNPVDYASVANDFAATLRKKLAGPFAERIEKAIYLHEAALGIYSSGAGDQQAVEELRQTDNPYWRENLVALAPTTRESLQWGQENYSIKDFDFDCAGVYLGLGNSLKQRLLGDAAQNIERAIACYETAQNIFSKLGCLTSQAKAANGLGGAFQSRKIGSDLDNWRSSLKHYENAVKLHLAGGSPDFNVATSMHNYGTTLVSYASQFSNLSRTKRDEAIEPGIENLHRALKIRSQKEYPYYWAMTTSMLAGGYMSRLSGNRTENLDRAIDLFEQVLAYSELNHTQNSSLFQVLSNLGRALLLRKDYSSAHSKLAEAISGYEAAGMIETSLTPKCDLADSLVGLGRHEEAVQALADGIEQLESLRNEATWHGTRRHRMVHINEFVDRLVELTWDLDVAEALRWSEPTLFMVGSAEALNGPEAPGSVWKGGRLAGDRVGMKEITPHLRLSSGANRPWNTFAVSGADTSAGGW